MILHLLQVSPTVFYLGGNGVNVKNNIIYINRGGNTIKTGLYYNSSVTSSNNNVIYMGPTEANNYVGNYGFNGAKATLADWQGTGYDILSSSRDPLFFNGVFVPNEPMINNIGASGLGVPNDIVDSVRSTSPDPGAYEFSVSQVDAAIALVSPAVPVTAGLKTVTVSITNNSSADNITSINLGYGDGATTISQMFTGLNIAPGATQSLTFTTQYNVTMNAKFMAYISLVNNAPDLNAANDTARLNICIPLNGNYTVNPNAPATATNFTSLQALAEALSCSGVSGAVVANVIPGAGVHSGPVTISQIPNASSTNTVTINGNSQTLRYYGTVSTSRSALILNGADHVVIDGFTIDVAGASFGWGILLTGRADSNIIRNCRILASVSSTEHAGIMINGSTSSVAATGNNGNGNLIEGNTVTGGHYSIYLYGSATTYNIGNIVRDNSVVDFGQYGVYLYGQQNAAASGNDVSRPTRTTFAHSGIYISQANGGLLIEKNRVHDIVITATTTSTAYGIFVAGAASAANPNRLQNNLIYNIRSTDDVHAIYSPNYSYWSYYHNTIVLDDRTANAANTYGISVWGASGVHVKNNIVSINKAGTGTKAALNYGTAGVATSDYNVLHMASTSGSSSIGFLTTPRTTLADWQATGYDLNSISADPAFTAAFVPTAGIVDDRGESGLGVAFDITNALRKTSAPDPGAFEFSTLVTGRDMKTHVLISPSIAPTNCYSAETVTVRIKNNSTSDIDFAANPVTVTTTVTGAGTQTLSTVINTGILKSDSTLDVTLPGVLNMTAAGVYDISTSTTVAGDVNTMNDVFTVSRRKEALSAGVVTSTPGSYCLTGGAHTLSVKDSTGAASLQWQQSTTPGTGFANIAGATAGEYSVTTPNTQTIYYRLIATCGTETDTSAETSAVVSTPAIASTVPDTTCGAGPVTLVANPNAGSVVEWYTDPTGGLAIATGSSLSINNLATTRTYYAQAMTGGGTELFVGATSPDAFSNKSTASSTSIYQRFDVAAPIRLISVDVYPGTTATLGQTASILIRNSNADLIATIPYTITVNDGVSAQTVPMNLSLQPGVGYRMYQGSPARNLTRNNGGASYPMSNGPVTITGNSFSSNYWFAFYNWRFNASCVNPVRTAVTATVDNDPNCTVLPVEMLSFRGETLQDANLLTWSTSTEINNLGFEVERSADGINFSKIGFEKTKAENGNATTVINYAFTDSRPLAGNNYYRLKQTDKDGKRKYSAVVVLKGDKVRSLTISSVYPNPVVNKVSVKLLSPANESVQLVITDLSGKVVHQQSASIAAGENRVQLQVQKLASGTYFIKAVSADGSNSSVHKLLKQ